jgi:CheY-like chemotaxis protein
VHVAEASSAASIDGRFEHTAEIAAKVDQKGSDEYGLGRRPSGPQASSSNRSTPSRLEKLQQKTDSETSSRQLTDDSSKPLQVLLVEDNIINQRILRRKLEAKGFKVKTANNGREAVDAVYQISTSKNEAATVFDVILMDQEMPVLDGNSATKEIRELEAQGCISHIPILGVTANVREEQKDDMRAAGMDGALLLPYDGVECLFAKFSEDIISKPYGIDQMVTLIKKFTAKDGV